MVRVLFDPVKSAEPPIVSGNNLLICSRTSSLDFLVAISGNVFEITFFKALIFFGKFTGASQLKILLNSVCFVLDNFANSCSQISQIVLPFIPIVSHFDFISVGIEKAGNSHL